MTFRQLNARYFEPAAQWTMIAGLVFLGLRRMRKLSSKEEGSEAHG